MKNLFDRQKDNLFEAMNELERSKEDTIEFSKLEVLSSLCLLLDATSKMLSDNPEHKVIISLEKLKVTWNGLILDSHMNSSDTLIEHMIETHKIVRDLHV